MPAYHVITPEGKVRKTRPQDIRALPWVPEKVEIPLRQIAQAARKGLMSLCVQVGLAVLQATMDHEVAERVAPKGKHRKDRQAYRHGRGPGWAAIGGRKVHLKRPRVRRKGGGEIPLESYEWAQQDDSLNEAVLARMLRGVATRDYTATLENMGEVPAFGTSKSPVGERFIGQIGAQIQQHLSRRLDDLHLVALLVDGVRKEEWTVVVGLGVDTEGRKHVLGFREGATENEAVCRSLLEDLVERGLRYEQGFLVVIDGAKGLRAAVRAVFGKQALVQRCTVHKKRNVLEHLPDSQARWVSRKLTQAYREPDYAQAKAALERLIEQLEVQHPGAAASLREGLEDGVEKAKLKRRAKELGLKNVRFLPLQPREEYAKMMRASDVRLVTLHPDVATPVVPSKILSIMAAGRPVVASIPVEGDGPRLIEESQCGLCVSPGNPIALAEVIRRLASNSSFADQLGKNGSQGAEAKYSLLVCINHYEQSFKNLSVSFEGAPLPL